MEEKLARNIIKNPKDFYAYAGENNKLSSTLGSLKLGEDTFIKDDLGMAKVLNDFFMEVLNNNFKLTGDCALKYNGRVEMPDCSFNREDIIHLLRSIKPTKAPGPDNVYPKVLVECAEEVADIILTIFKSTCDSGLVPIIEIV